MNFKSTVLLASSCAVISLTGCVDNKYDLGGMDTDTRIYVKDLVIPVNLDPVKLGDFIKIEDGSALKVITVNGKECYAVQQSGTFSTNKITVPTFDYMTRAGEINIPLGNYEIAEIDLSGIPDFFRGGETNLKVADPQLYLRLNNPLASMQVELTTKLGVNSYRYGQPTLHFSVDGDATISYDHGAGPYCYAFAENENTLSVPADFTENLTFESFSTFGDALACPDSWNEKGLPDRMTVDLSDITIVGADITKVRPGQDINAIEGIYEFFVPIAIKENSVLVYEDTKTGWLDDDLRKLTITGIELTSDITNGCPVDVTLKIWPVDINGQVLRDVDVTASTIKANSTEPYTIRIYGSIRDLDGIHLEAVVVGSADESALSPDQALKLDNLRAKVSGYYQTDFK